MARDWRLPSCACTQQTCAVWYSIRSSLRRLVFPAYRLQHKEPLMSFSIGAQSTHIAMRPIQTSKQYSFSLSLTSTTNLSRLIRLPKQEIVSLYISQVMILSCGCDNRCTPQRSFLSYLPRSSTFVSMTTDCFP